MARMSAEALAAAANAAAAHYTANMGYVGGDPKES